MAKRLAHGRADELLDGVMDVIAARGFSTLRMADLAAELHCSAATLYKLAPSKTSLVLIAIRRRYEHVLEDMDATASEESTASQRARTYFLLGAESIRPLSSAFRSDVDHYESTRMLWRDISEHFIDRFSDLLGEAKAAGEIRPVNTRFLAEVLRRTGLVTRDEGALAAAGLTAEQALREVDLIIWEGICPRS